MQIGGVRRYEKCSWLRFSCSFKPCLVLSHPLLHVLFTMTRVIYYICVSSTVMRLKCFHPFFECFTFSCYFT